jgi:hypothetical protein
MPPLFIEQKKDPAKNGIPSPDEYAQKHYTPIIRGGDPSCIHIIMEFIFTVAANQKRNIGKYALYQKILRGIYSLPSILSNRSFFLARQKMFQSCLHMSTWVC